MLERSKILSERHSVVKIKKYMRAELLISLVYCHLQTRSTLKCTYR